ncbi:YihY family inner membrane protein [Luteimonas arsenica]|uniref:YihY family inner membrane protein n=1 Tax=Luteimonas arsenica TaxID=1586242 RepID=UPI001054BBF8|nr:YihY family inner membrane protein [Luteimonas arsenica]
MEPLDSLNRWADRMRDRARAMSFGRFLWRRFLDDRLFEAAGALSFTTTFALVPLSMVVFGVLSAFPVFEEWRDLLSEFLFANFVPSSAQGVRDWLLSFSENTGKLTAVGVIALVVSVLVTLFGIESAFNRIWRVHTARPQLSRFLVYWTVLTLGALVAAASLSVVGRLFELEVFRTDAGQWLQSAMLDATPVVVELLAFALIYRVVPHRTVQWRHAFAGSVVAVVLLEIGRRLISIYLGSFNAYQNIYGAVAFVPIFLLWLYFGWVSILLGASFAASVSAFRYQPAHMRLPQGYEIYAMLRLLARFREARREGRGLHSDDILACEPVLTDTLVQDTLAQLESISVVRRAETGEWLLARDLDELSLAELYEAGQLRIPIAEAHLPGAEDAHGAAVIATIDELRLPLRDLLRRRVGDCLDQTRE